MATKTSPAPVDQPFFDRWRAKLIANLDPGAVGELDTIRWRRSRRRLRLVIDLRFDGEPCEPDLCLPSAAASRTATSPTRSARVHRHLGHAFDVLFTADRVGLGDPCDDDAVDAHRFRRRRPPAAPRTTTWNSRSTCSPAPRPPSNSARLPSMRAVHRKRRARDVSSRRRRTLARERRPRVGGRAGHRRARF